MKKNFSNSNKRDSISTVSSHQSTIPRNPPPVSSSSTTSSSKPIADYFPSASILFADIVGFTSWASIRDPAQVFILLETVYGRFDDIAKKKGVFKVETIGDCYVAATGLPTPRTDHAIVMASFARRCLENMLDLLESRELENELGMGTNDLGMRFGIHSGSVIGGVLRGAKSRYQLFGDTINTASRIESSSMKNKIHLSEQTAELLIAGGKMSWVEEREEKIHAKGKGELQTYWL
ncbi:adenylyl cyclase, partial [Fragilariopsis cylindrus CCMP1102]